LKHGDILSLLVPDSNSDNFNPEESVMYRFHNMITPTSSKIGAPFLAAQVKALYLLCDEFLKKEKKIEKLAVENANVCLVGAAGIFFVQRVDLAGG
jgi:hypothetical protein